MKRAGRIWHVREASTLAILMLEIVFFGWYLWPDGGGSYHPFLNSSNALLVLKYSSIYGIAAIGADIVIISGGIDLSPGAVIALASVATGGLLVDAGWGLAPSIAAGLLVGVVSGLLVSLLVIVVQLPPFIATLGAMGIVRGAGFILTEGRSGVSAAGVVDGFGRALALSHDQSFKDAQQAVAIGSEVLQHIDGSAGVSHD